MKNKDVIKSKLYELYSSFGYKKIRLSSFEKYALYAEHLDFLPSQSIISFSGQDGNLLALRPDVTLSVAKNTKANDNYSEKMFYNEKIYRYSKNYLGYKELSQVGVELLGKSDIYSMAEICLLAIKSLEIISSNCSLLLSSISIIEGLFEKYNLTAQNRSEIYSCLRHKNAHGVESYCDEVGICQSCKQSFVMIARMSGNFEESVMQISKIDGVNTNSIKDLLEIYKVVSACGYGKNIRLDFSIEGSVDYYNGIIFSGYAEGVPTEVLVGGRYDRLTEKLGKSCGALGFAVLLDSLALEEKRQDVDVLVVYNQEQDVEKVFAYANKLIKNGKKVRVSPTENVNISFGELVVFSEEMSL